MRALFLLERLKAQMGGGAVAMFRLAEELQRRGWEVSMQSLLPPREPTIRGRRVLRWTEHQFFDVVVAGAGTATDAALRMGVPVVSCVHSAVNEAWAAPTESRPVDIMLWGSASFLGRAQDQGYQTSERDMVAWPIISQNEVLVPRPGEAVTLVNPIPEKGGHLIWEIARLLPEVQFLVVRGGWWRNRQVIPSRLPRNVEVMEYQSDSREVYRRTRLLLYPIGMTAGPGWMHGVGMAALEAAVSGIPTIAYPGPGLVESLGPAGTFVESTDAAPWAEAIQTSLRPARYSALSELAISRMRQVADRSRVDELDQRMRAAVAAGVPA